MYLLQPLVFFPVEQPSKLTPLASSAQDRGNCQHCLSEKLEIVMQQYLRDCNHCQKVKFTELTLRLQQPLLDLYLDPK